MESGGKQDVDTPDDSLEYESYYELLGVAPEAPHEEVVRAYREAAKRHHPDASDAPREAAEAHFREILAARDVLTSVESRTAYDELGHDEYCRQSADLGKNVRHDAGTPDSAGPEHTVSAQPSESGGADSRSDPLVTPTKDGVTGVESETEGRTAGRGLYRFVFDEMEVESTSLEQVSSRWRSLWRRRALAGVGGVSLLGMASLLVPAVEPAGRATLSLTPLTLYLSALAVMFLYTGYRCLLIERALPRGVFLADRDLGRFATDAGHTARRRGFGGAVVALLLVGSAEDPWTHAAGTLRGDVTGVSWVDASVVGLDEWTGGIDPLVTGVFALAALGGTGLLAVGTSVAVWRARYEKGLRIRPSLWEGLFVFAPLSVLCALLFGAVEVVSLSWLSLLPEPALALLSVDGTTVTFGTLATVGLLGLLVCVPLYRVRVAVETRLTSESTQT